MGMPSTCMGAEIADLAQRLNGGYLKSERLKGIALGTVDFDLDAATVLGESLIHSPDAEHDVVRRNQNRASPDRLAGDLVVDPQFRTDQRLPKFASTCRASVRSVSSVRPGL